MIIARGREDAAASGRRENTFTGEVWADPVIPMNDQLQANSIFFTPGSRTFWHRHERGQLLVVTSGLGLVCVDGEEPQQIRAGDVVWCPPGERHWHGATADTYMTHLAVSLGATQWETEVLL